MNASDAFEDLARYYDPLMEHVNYDRWFFTTVALADLAPDNFRHLDAACGTATLVEKLRKTGWNSVGIDLSAAMVSAGKKKNARLPLAVSDLRALPFHESMDLVTCLFDSLNFLLEEDELAKAFRQLHGTLRPGGILYADIITERMVTEHFEGQDWEENNDGFTSRWTSHYDHRSGVAQSHVRVNTGASSVITERVYPQDVVEPMLRDAGFEVLGVFDAESWKAPRKKTTRIDFIAVIKGAPGLKKRFDKVVAQVREMVYAT
jgi:SAM-dependent methyltransferase